MRKYHQACIGKKNTLLLVKGKEGKIFGGFMENPIPKNNNHTNFGGKLS